ncbi:uncharacterized protein LOC132060990 [Lycium ferocissimum]|uniref:uncharacterized protein LOC132060990 n=1 Tax=Lycium ferocissimum TaxID=112874 RepID=UPI00281570DB|nr:uncharacterized protein LOC132060990 [Lycium ferocissimum]
MARTKHETLKKTMKKKVKPKGSDIAHPQLEWDDIFMVKLNGKKLYFGIREFVIVTQFERRHRQRFRRKLRGMASMNFHFFDQAKVPKKRLVRVFQDKSLIEDVATQPKSAKIVIRVTSWFVFDVKRWFVGDFLCFLWTHLSFLLVLLCKYCNSFCYEYI